MKLQLNAPIKKNKSTRAATWDTTWDATEEFIED
jgi:hypothetical protein